MPGIRFLTDEKGRKVAVQIDLRKHGAIWEDFYDGLVSERRRKEKGVSLETVKPDFINRAVPAALLAEETRKLATRCAGASSFTVALGKQAFYAQVDLDQPKAYAYAKEVMTLNSVAADAQEGISAFLEKRTPWWNDH